MIGRILSGEITTERLQNGDIMDVVSFIYENKIVAIARKVKPFLLPSAAEALYWGGIRLLEVTFNQSSSTAIKDTVDSILGVKALLGDKICVGAGTVLTSEQAVAAKNAGADFILSPNTNPEIIRKAKELGMVAVPGAFTPTEILTAWDAGADIVKLFPASNLGLGYVKAIKAPISHVPLMAVGGVNEDNIASFLSSGFCSCGIGSNLVRNDLIEAGKFDELSDLASSFVRKIEVAK